MSETKALGVSDDAPLRFGEQRSRLVAICAPCRAIVKKKCTLEDARGEPHESCEGCGSRPATEFVWAITT